MKRSIVSIFFYPRIINSDKNYAYLMCRVTIDAVRYVFSLHHKVLATEWEPSHQRVHPKSKDAFIVNNLIGSIRNNIFEAHRNLSDNGIYVTSKILQAELNRDRESENDFKKFYQEYLLRKKEMIASEITVEHYNKEARIFQKFSDFLDQKQIESFSFSDLNTDIGKSFFNYLKNICKLSHNTAIKHMQMFKCVVKDAVNKGRIPHDPMRELKLSMKDTPRPYLIMEEIESIESLNGLVPRLELVRDIFIFSCYTGLAYIDVKQLTTDNIRKGIDGRQWIYTSRQKTEVNSNIPVLPKAQIIIDKYSSTTMFRNKRLLPILSNQKMNSYLKEIADRCNIKKVLTFHVARHSFATTVTLANGVSIESVSKMLGHKLMKTTQHYAKVVDQRVSDDMINLEKKLTTKKD